MEFIYKEPRYARARIDLDAQKRARNILDFGVDVVSAQARNIMRREGIECLADLKAWANKQASARPDMEWQDAVGLALCMLPNCGLKSVHEIKRLLGPYSTIRIEWWSCEEPHWQ